MEQLDKIGGASYLPVMKPLFHPAREDITLEGVLHALADPVRLRIFAMLARAERPLACAVFGAMDDRVVPKSTLSQHFSTLRECGLVRSERRGTSQYNTLRWEDFEPRYGSVVNAILAAHEAELEPVEMCEHP